MLKVDAVTLERGSKTVLQEVSVTFAPGKFTAVLGPNGAGKSTLLKLITGELTATSGTVSLEGQPLEAHPRHALACRRAVLPQNSPLSFGFTVEEVVRLGRTPHPGAGESAHCREVAQAALGRLGITALAERRYTALSGGERQRVHLARVLAQIWEPPADGKPPILLLDEPTNNLDLAHRHTILHEGQRLADAGAIVVVVLHDLNATLAYADEAVLMHHGRIVASGPVESVLNPPRIAAVFDVRAVPVPVPGQTRKFFAIQPNHPTRVHEGSR